MHSDVVFTPKQLKLEINTHPQSLGYSGAV